MPTGDFRYITFDEGVLPVLYAEGSFNASGISVEVGRDFLLRCTAINPWVTASTNYTLHCSDGTVWQVMVSSNALVIKVGPITFNTGITVSADSVIPVVLGFIRYEQRMTVAVIYDNSFAYHVRNSRGLALFKDGVADDGTTIAEFLLRYTMDDCAYWNMFEGGYTLDTTLIANYTNYAPASFVTSHTSMLYKQHQFTGYYPPIVAPDVKDISAATITLTPNTFAYDGEAKTPTVTVTIDGVQLTEGVDYIKTYENNINPGTASVLVAGQGDYTGSQRVYFTISSGIDTNDIANATITLSPSMYYYDGAAKTPNVTVKMGAVQLTEGTDYIKTYENNINEGLSSVLVAGQGDYTGSKRAYFSIYSATNPYGGLEPSGPSDTTPTYDYSSDAISLPTLPGISMADVGLVRIYNPTKAQLNSLAQYLWTDTTFIDTLINHFKQIFESPMNAIIALNLLPCPVPNSGAQELKVMYIPTGVQMNVATNQFVDVDCGKVTIETVYGSALDYTPYTRASIFLPYVGQVSLNVDEIMGKVLRVHYRVDIVTGGCVALIDVDGTVMYQFSGHCAISMPLTGADFSNLIGALIQSAKAAATIAGGGVAAIAGAAEGAARFASSRKSTPSASAEMGNKIAAMDSDMMDFGGLAARNIGNTVGAVMGSKPDISRTGTFSGNTGYLGIRRPYVILERPRLCNPAEYGKFNGYPSMQTVQLNNVRGYTQVQQVQLTGISATGPELDELQTLLKQGVIL